MPNCFQLLRDGAAVPLSEIDEEMCRHFEEHCDPEVYFRDWYSSIGYDLAMGRSFEQIEAIYASPEWAEFGLLPIAQWLRANFTPRSWHERRRAQCDEYTKTTAGHDRPCRLNMDHDGTGDHEPVEQGDSA